MTFAILILFASMMFLFWETAKQLQMLRDRITKLEATSKTGTNLP